MNETVERVILVNSADEPIGTAEKLEAHRRGVLHRAFSVFAINARGEILLQQRAIGKYHCGGLWSNSCCVHPRPGEETGAAARRRLREELGIDAQLQPVFSFSYRADLAGGLTEHEIDHVLVGRVEEDPDPDPAEVQDWRWTAPEKVLQELHSAPDSFTPWFEPAFEGLLERQYGMRAIPSDLPTR